MYPLYHAQLSPNHEPEVALRKSEMFRPIDGGAILFIVPVVFCRSRRGSFWHAVCARSKRTIVGKFVLDNRDAQWWDAIALEFPCLNMCAVAERLTESAGTQVLAYVSMGS